METLEETIENFKEEVKMLRCLSVGVKDSEKAADCLKRANNIKQIVEWLEDYKRLLESEGGE